MKSKALILSAVMLGVAVVYQNCSPVHSGGAVNSSLSGCGAATFQVFQDTYYTQVMRSADTSHNCLPCHDTGGAAGASRWFAQDDPVAAFGIFQSVGRSHVEANMTNAGHQPPHTGPQNQSFVNAATPLFVAAEKAQAACSGSTALTTVDKMAAAAVYTATPLDSATWPKLTWDLDTDLADPTQLNQIHMTISLEVRRFNNSTDTTQPYFAYQFRNPIVTVKPTGGVTPTYTITNISMNLNDSVLATMTTYSLMSVTVNSTTGQNIASGDAISLAPVPSMLISASDKFSLSFASITDGSGNPVLNTGGGTTTGGSTSNVPARVSFADLQSSNAITGVFTRSCDSCHKPGNLSGGLDLTSYGAANSEASLIKSRANNASNPMPPSGLMSAQDRAVINAWIASGSPQN